MSNYLKVMLDAIFGPENFRNDNMLGAVRSKQ
jgi:adenine specific DNA methylase Mod